MAVRHMVVVATDPDDLSAKVDGYLAHGWSIVGRTFFVDHVEYGLWCQTMVI